MGSSDKGSGIVAEPPSFLPWIWRGSGPMRHALAAGAIAGAISAGAGGRVAMRLIALANSSHDGALTDFGATVGEITFGGTIFLLIFGAFIGVFGGAAYLGLRRWLAVPAAWRGLAFGAVTLLTVGNLLIDPHNVDFEILEPAFMTVSLFAALFFVNGLILAPLADRLHPEPSYGGPAWAPRAAAAVLVALCLVGLFGTVINIRKIADHAGTCLASAEEGGGCALRPVDAAAP
jgi:hypothetical protein